MGMGVSLVTYLSRMSPYDTCGDKLSSPDMRVFSDIAVLAGVVFLLLLWRCDAESFEEVPPSLPPPIPPRVFPLPLPADIEADSCVSVKVGVG